MSNKNKKEVKEVKVKNNTFKGYDINWLRKNPEHPDYKLVEQFDKKNK